MFNGIIETNDDAISVLKSMIPEPRRADTKSTIHSMQCQALYKGIHALENQKPVQAELEEVRTELLNICGHNHCMSCNFHSARYPFCRIKSSLDERIKDMKGE